MMTSKARKMTARFDGTCPHCQGAIAAGSEIVFVPSARPGTKARHMDCQRADVLPGKIFAAGLKSLTDSFDEMYWRGVEATLQAELTELKAKIAARAVPAAA